MKTVSHQSLFAGGQHSLSCADVWKVVSTTGAKRIQMNTFFLFSEVGVRKLYIYLFLVAKSSTKEFVPWMWNLLCEHAVTLPSRGQNVPVHIAFYQWENCISLLPPPPPPKNRSRTEKKTTKDMWAQSQFGTGNDQSRSNLKIAPELDAIQRCTRKIPQGTNYEHSQLY